MPESPPEDLRELARSCGVHVEYTDTSGNLQDASTESLLAVLRALGAEIDGPIDAARVLAERRLAAWRRAIEPVVVAWDGLAPAIEVRVPASLSSSTIACRLIPEVGEARSWTTAADQLAVTGSAEIGGHRFVARRLVLPEALPWGYHRIVLTIGDEPSVEALVISAPTRSYAGPEAGGKRPWGVFCPLHALHGPSSWGAGDHSDLEALMDWTRSLGGSLVATLPMLATAFDGPNPIISPYSPTSRLFWNEFYLDLRSIPGLARCEAARAAMDSAEAEREVDSLRADPFVKYGRQMRLKRAVLEHLAADFFDQGGERDPAFVRFIREHPDVEAYASFQAAGERHGRNWRDWPGPNSEDPVESPGDLGVRRYHLYAQWQADEQLRALADKARRDGMTWYLDFPVGVDFNSFDVYREQESFAIGASVGCPPDSVFTKGQNWGFPPLHPERQRENGYRYLIASFRNHFRYANALRIDHVMGLHRLFWIPDGAEASRGAFVSYPAAEIYAILAVESHRREAWVVGEDLGTVPPEVASALDRHGVRGMYVVQYEIKPDPEQPLRPVPEATVASINTHDMPPFAAYWQGVDLDDRLDLGLLDAESLATERESRQRQREAIVAFLAARGYLEPARVDARSVLQGVWDWLAASPSRVLLLNVEDLWLETESQNTPNTFDERPNWSRKIRQAFDQFSVDPRFLQALRAVDRGRSTPTEVDAIVSASGSPSGA